MIHLNQTNPNLAFRQSHFRSLFPNCCGAPLVRVAHFLLLRRYVMQLRKVPFYKFYKFYMLKYSVLTILRRSTFFYKVLQTTLKDTVFLHFSINSTLFSFCRKYNIFIYRLLVFADICRTCSGGTISYMREKFFICGETVFFWALPKGGLLFRYRSVRRRSLGWTAIGHTGYRDTASRISFTCFTYCLPALIPLCQQRLAWWYSLWQHSALTARQTRLSVGLSRGTLLAPVLRWPMSFDGCHYQTSAIVRHIGSLHSAGAVQFTSSLTIPNAVFLLSLLIGYTAAHQTIKRYNCNILLIWIFMMFCLNLRILC